ncbi:MAG: hypothetical protein HJJLKODD_02469 [Phycisphaerae bacterium]|nr:hypothetical protein [Phycisphaerae bacterium]
MANPWDISAIDDWVRRWRGAVLPLLLLLGAGLAVGSARSDSATFDEPHHYAAGLSKLHFGDFRMSPDPPLGQWCTAWTGLLQEVRWPAANDPVWQTGDFWGYGRLLVFERNDPQRLLIPARYAMVGWLVVLWLVVWRVARQLAGETGGMLAVTAAVLHPGLLAHGHYVTTDLPMTLATLLVLWGYGRLAVRISWAGVLFAAAALTAASLIKFTWILLLPAVVVMLGLVIWRGQPLRSRYWPIGREAKLFSISQRASSVLLITLVTGVVGYIGIWSCYGWRYSAVAGHDPRGHMMVIFGGQPLTSEDLAGVWEQALRDEQGQPLNGMTASFVRWARSNRFLPEAYLYGLIFTRQTTVERPTYFLGQLAMSGRASYFPVVWLIKSPLGWGVLLLLALAGGVWLGRWRSAQLPLFAGLVIFAMVYVLVAVGSDLNIGYRHLLPVDGVLVVLCGAAAWWMGRRWGWLVVGAAVFGQWLSVGLSYPHFIAYFNEAVGGPAQAHRFVVDSNLDWGQDLLRLRQYAQDHSGEQIKLAYFGNADPRAYGLDVEVLPSFYAISGPPAALTAGTYVLSVTQLAGVYFAYAADYFWANPEAQVGYAQSCYWLAQPEDPQASADERQARREIIQQLEAVRAGRLMWQLRRRTPDERIGWSLWVYRLSQQEVDQLLLPESSPR